MKAAINFSYGDGTKSHKFKIGDELPKEIASELDPKFILEMVAKDDPSSLSRDQLMMLAGLGDYEVEGAAPIEYDEGQLRDALAEFSKKSDIVEWFETVHPGSDILDAEGQTRAAMVDLIVEELTGE